MAGKQVKPCLLLALFYSFLVCVFLLFCSALVSVLGSSKARIPSLNVIIELNSRGPYTGLITVYSPEENPFFSTGCFKPDPTHPVVDLSGRRFRIGQVHGMKVIYVRCGIGLTNAAAATQQMLDHFNIKGIIHFGIAGNLNNSMSIGDVTIPQQFVHTGIWDWVNPSCSVDSSDFGHLDIGTYNVPKGNQTNLLGHIGYNKEEFYSVSGEANVAQSLIWAKISPKWLQLASSLEGLKLHQCLNESLCLPQKPKLVVGLRATTTNIFVDNAAYRDFLHEKFQVSSTDMESSAVIMTSLSNGCPIIVIRGLSDFAGRQQGENAIGKFGTLAALNAAKAVIAFIDKLAVDYAY